jgi:hypothetical protein
MAKRNAWVAAAVAAGLSGMGLSASAEDNFWTGAVDNDWNKPANWSLGRVPVQPSSGAGGFDDAVVNTLTNFPVITVDLAATPRDIIVGSGAGTNGRVDQTAGTAATGQDNWFFVGRDGGTATYNLAKTAETGGTLTGFGQATGSISTRRLYVGGTEFANPGSTGTMNVNTSGTLTIRNDLAVGVRGSTGVMNVDAGTITTGGWNFIGHEFGLPGGNGTLNMSGGSLTNGGGRTYVGLFNSTGKLVMSGTATYSNPGDWFSIGELNFANPTTPQVVMNGGTLNTALLVVGGQPDQPGKGELLVQNDNARVNAGEFWVGQHANGGGVGNGVATVSAGKVTSSGWIAVGRLGGVGTLNLSGAAVVEKTGGANTHIIIHSLGGTGIVNQAGGTLQTVGGGDIRIGEGATGSGTWNLSGGVGSADAVRVGWAGGPAIVNVSGGQITTGQLVLAEGGAGTVAQSGGTVAVGGDLNVRANPTQAGAYSLTGGTLSVDGAINTNGGVFTFGGGGRITRSDSGIITYNGDLTVADKLAGFTLNNDKAFDVNGILTVPAGMTFDVTGQSLPAGGGAVVTGSINLGSVDSIAGTFDPATTNVQGLANPAGATFISEFQGEGGLFNPNTQSVFWVQENDGQVDLRYSIAVPEPTSLAFLAVGGLAHMGRRRGRR